MTLQRWQEYSYLKRFVSDDVNPLQRSTSEPSFCRHPRDRPRIGIVTTLEPYWAANTPFIREYLGELDIPVTVASARELGHAVDVLCATGGSAALRAVITDADRRNWNLQNALPDVETPRKPIG